MASRTSNVKSKVQRKTTGKDAGKIATKVADNSTKKSASKTKATAKRGTKKAVLLSGGNPQIAKGDGNAPVQAYIAALSGWQRERAKRLDALITRACPNVRKAVKWNSPFYGVAAKEGEKQSFFLGLHTFTKYLKVAFFSGTSLTPVPPGNSKVPGNRYLDIHENDHFDEAQLESWVKQAAAIPGWTP